MMRRLSMDRLATVLCCFVLVLGQAVAQEPVGEQKVAAVPVDAAQDWQSGWIQLFDQATTFGWRGAQAQVIQDGQLVLRAGAVARTSAQFSAFTLQIKYRLEPNSEAELLLLANPRAREAGVDHVSLRFVPDQNQLSVVVVQENQNSGPAKSSVKYQFHNGQGQADGEPKIGESSLGRGYLGFRVTVGTLHIEQVSLLPTLPAAELYSTLEANRGFDLRGIGAARAELVDGVIAVRGGPGYLATTPSYADFVLSIDARAQAGTNSGVFFRCIPGEDLNGYESQIHNGTVGGDRAQPEDCGTGGIFRRVNARRVVADEGQWFRKVIMVCGGQISVWVNGYQVTDWSDQRPPNENPRRGRRLEAGTVMLQAHDPSTQVDFKNLNIVELPAR
ncbi:MAG: DUF1080 domain-containing protein [Pirellulaceae bacterium]|nr:DUF1080 domain-containing protein [Pirellulaceae bacterium]